MIRALFKDSAIYTVPSILMHGLPLLLLPLYSRVMGAADFGRLELIVIFSGFVNLIVAFEISQAVARFYGSEYRESVKREFASTALWFMLAFYLFFFVVSFCFASEFSYVVMGEKGLEQIFLVVLLYVGVNGIFNFMQNQFKWELRSRKYAAASILVTLVTVIGVVAFSYKLGWGLEGVLLGMLFGVSSGVVYSVINLKKSFVLFFSKQHLFNMLKFSMPLVFSGIAVWGGLYVDRIMINILMTVDDVGVYGVGYRLASIVGLIIVGFQGALMPLIYAHHHKHETSNELAVVFRWFVVFALHIFLGIHFFSEWIVRLFTTEEFYDSVGVIVYLVPSILLHRMYIFAPGIGLEKRTMLVLLISLLGVLVNFGLNYLFIPLFGTVGASISTLIAGSLVFLLYMMFSQRFYYVPHEWLQIILFVGVGALLAYVIPYIFMWWGNQIIISVAGLFLMFLFSIFLNMVRMDEIRKVLNYIRFAANG